MGGRDIAVLLRGMEPVLSEAPYGVAVWSGGALAFPPVATAAEGMESEAWARISANVIAGFHHDQILVQGDKRHDAMAALRELSRA